MNTVWSTYIQKIGTLYNSHSLRFSDIFKEKYIKSLSVWSCMIKELNSGIQMCP